MSFGRLSCSCGGENANCYRCDGTGFYTPSRDTPSPPRTDELRPKRKIAAKVDVDPRVVAEAKRLFQRATEKTGDWLRWEWLSQASKDSWMREALEVRRALKPRISKNVCPVCHRPVCRISSHQVNLLPPLPGTTKTVSKNKKKKVRQSLIGHKEQARVRRQGKKAVVPQDRLSPQPGGRARVSQPEGPTTDPVKEKLMDASYGWGGSFRDHGRFGSHPSFDAMDDESLP